MPSIKDLKKRIGSVKNTQQTTKAMKMVSAAKLRRAQEAIQSQRPYAQKLGEMLKLAANAPGVSMESPLLSREVTEGPKKVLLVVVTSDRGLCGGFNGNVIKGAMKWIKTQDPAQNAITLGFLGRKGFDFYKTRRYTIGPNFVELTGKVTFTKAKKLSDQLIEKYLAGEFDEVRFIFNEFKNAVTQVVRVEGFLPLAPTTSESGDAAAESMSGAIVKPSPAELFDALLSKHFPVQAFRVMLDSQASEHGARMSSMENATKNAGEMIRKLTLQFNKQRQAGITKELLEIISGAESAKAQ